MVNRCLKITTYGDESRRSAKMLDGKREGEVQLHTKATHGANMIMMNCTLLSSTVTGETRIAGSGYPVWNRIL